MRKKPPTVEFKSAIGEPPPMLLGHALEIWHELLPELVAAGLGCRVESYPLSCLCLALADVAAATKDIEVRGLTIQGDRGYVKNPSFAVKVSAMVIVHRISSAFGMTPASRGRAKFSSPQSKQDYEDSEEIRKNDPEGYARWMKKYGTPPTNEFACL